MGEIIASQIIAPHVLQRYNFAAGYSLVEIKLGRRFEGKTLVESKVRQSYGLNIVALAKAHSVYHGRWTTFLSHRN